MAADEAALLAAGEWRRGEAAGGGEFYLAPGVELGPGAVVDASGGAVLLDREVEVGALSVLTGPCYLGPGTRLKPHSQLHGVWTGPQCRLGGEIEETQFQGYANKQHHGFLGHAAVGEWVNLGAGATNSDLKNNYSGVRVEQGGRQLETQQRFLGCCLGDHVKLGIQGRLSTGTVLEPFTNWFGGDFPAKGLPPFTWGGDGELVEHALEKALATAAIAMGRRGQVLTPAAAAVARALFAETAAWRRERLG
jgi:UDP-N-acetylglucosamine diphosphorylase/glucosamine-1-phosphate N-acetyltransferase